MKHSATDKSRPENESQKLDGTELREKAKWKKTKATQEELEEVV